MNVFNKKKTTTNKIIWKLFISFQRLIRCSTTKITNNNGNQNRNWNSEYKTECDGKSRKQKKENKERNRYYSFDQWNVIENGIIIIIIRPSFRSESNRNRAKAKQNWKDVKSWAFHRFCSGLAEWWWCRLILKPICVLNFIHAANHIYLNKTRFRTMNRCLGFWCKR